MIEVPSAVMMAEELASEVDFFSVGSNDLARYVLAVDRMHPVLSRQAEGVHPAVETGAGPRDARSLCS